MLRTPPCCCLALDVLAGKDLLKSSYITEIPSSHNSFLKTLTGSIMQSSPQDALSHTRGAAWPWARRGEGFSVPVCLQSLATAWPILKHQPYHTRSVQRLHSLVKFPHSSLSERTIPNWIYNCQHSSCVLERPDLLETCSMEMESSRLGRGPQSCAEKVLWWSLLSSMWPQPVVLGWRKVISQHRTTLQCPLPPQQHSEEECLRSVFGTQYHCINLRLDLACNGLHELENFVWHLAEFKFEETHSNTSTLWWFV